mmetsp:Transcript_6051/g.10472  ORF Transcript_6051/g.10472 Transcript_6051/m.10472 type:complete len:131 (-) Transcript_6051:239-631(-)|eukprot:CAMPEP_0198211540 /NCGR_PEP_ID=MMETSP1445-20131203/24404_1 /TAXON_ID=36898 /ORGANISM="Pyramimonas sp., Strain CCMP2087" /LENGTH=130 /DNA_ID=CAMNT_0043885815 /DNA_START=387 /DNA_END=779 /DNA_ORIENTATION=+
MAGEAKEKEKPAPGEASRTFLKSMIGRQVDSRKKTSESAKFGTTERCLPGFGSTVSAKEIYFTKKHAMINTGKYSPGPKYALQGSVGKQSVSQKRTAASVGFGTAGRFAGSQPDVSVPDKCSPGPGRYNY